MDRLKTSTSGFAKMEKRKLANEQQIQEAQKYILETMAMGPDVNCRYMKMENGQFVMAPGALARWMADYHEEKR